MLQFCDHLALHKMNFISYDASSSYWDAWSGCEQSHEYRGQNSCENLTKIVACE